jgi:putative ABC transport system permease protein
MTRMGLSGIRYICAARLGARAVLVQEGFAIVGIAVGVALLLASQISATSLTRSEARLNTQLLGSAQVQLDARGPEGFAEGLLAQVRAVPGVRVALPIVERQVNLTGPGGERSVDLIGVDLRMVRLGVRLQRRFSAPQLATLPAIALPEPLALEIGTVGTLARLELQVGAHVQKTLVAATLREADIGDLVHSPIAIAPIRYAQSVAGAPDRLSRIFVRYDPARAGEVRATLARLAARSNVNFVPADFDSRLFAVAVAPESKSEALFSGISALVGFMFALNAMLLTVPQRRRLIEDLLPDGATRWMTIQILLVDAAVLGVLGCILGLALGDILSIAVFHSTPGYLAFAFPVGNARIVTWQSVALAIAAGLAAAVIGVLWPVREVLARPLRPRSSSPDHHRARNAALLTGGGLCLLLTTFTLLAETHAAVVGNVALVIALLCLLPFLFDGLVSAFACVSHLLNGVASAIAVTELRTPQSRVRSLAIAATAAVAVFGVVEFQGVGTNLKSGLESSIRNMDSSAEIWLIPRGRSSIQPTTPFTAVNNAALARVPGVSQLGAYRGSFLDWGDRRLWVIGPGSDIEHPVPAGQVISGNLKLASERVREGGWAVLSQDLASEHHLHVGQAFTLPSPRPQRMRVAALTTNLGWPPGAIILSSSSYARAWASNDPSAYEIQTTPGVSVVTVRNRVRNALKSQPGLAVESAVEREQRHYAVTAQGLSRLTQIRLLVLIAAVLALVGAIWAMIWQRRERVAELKSEGYGELLLWRWLLCEAAVLLTAGCLIGAIFGIYAQLLGSHFLSAVTGFPIVFNVEPIAAIVGFAMVTVVATLMLVLPGLRAVRVRPRTGGSAH